MIRVGSVVALLLGLAPLPAADWPHWRGPRRNDQVREHSGFRDGNWRLKEDWTVNVGAGASSPLLVEGRVYTIGWSEGREHVRCLDAQTGKEVWGESYPAPEYGRVSTGDKSLYSGTSATPEFDGAERTLYTLGTDGDLTRWRATNGEREWHVNLYERYGAGQRPDVGGKRNGASRRDYGYTTAPLIQGDQLIVEVGDTHSGTVKGFDKRTGEELWTSQCRHEAGHSGGPVPIDVDGLPCVAVLTMRALLVVRVDSGHEGETLGRYEWTTDFANNIPTPTAIGNRILVTSAYNQYGMVCLEASRSGLREVWRNDHPSGVCSPVVKGDCIYWSWQGIHCVDINSGEQLWVGGRTGTTGSCLLTAEGRLITWADAGELILTETEPAAAGEYHELARVPRVFRTDVWPHVVLADRRLLCKDRRGNLRCYLVGR